MTKKKICILLTSCINPNGMSFTKLQDPELRCQQYIDAVNFYLAKTDLQVVFVDNSGVDISNHFTTFITSNRLEILTFNGNNYDRSLGKGYGEALILEHALENSAVIRSSDLIVKITGRLKVTNVMALIKQAYNIHNLDILANLREMLSYADSRCFIGSPAFFEELIAHKAEINDTEKVNFEHILLKTIHIRMDAGHRFDLSKYFIRYKGMSGTSGTTLQHGFLYWFFKNLKYMMRYRLNK